MSPGKIPPHDVEAEAAILGAALTDPVSIVPNVRRRFGRRDVFYDIRHITAWDAISTLFDAGRAPDIITLNAFLQEHGTLSEAGGIAYLATLPDKCFSTANWPAWVDVLMDRWAERRLLRQSVNIREWLDNKESTVESVIRDTLTEVGYISEVRAASLDLSPRVKTPHAWGDAVMSLFQNTTADEEPGTGLPWGFKWKVRPGELTLAIGEKGTGKTTLLCYITMHMLSRGWKGFVSFMEEPPASTLKLLVTQLIGTKMLQMNDVNTVRVRSALDWYQSRLSIYDFLGIVDYRVLLQGMEYAAEHRGANWFIVDSLMRLGISDDDYAEQGRCVMALANFAIKHNAHVILVNHLNKSDAEARRRQRGSQQIVDNSNNVIQILRNEKKGIKLDELKHQRLSGAIPEEEFLKEHQKLSAEWDTKLLLLNQRYQGSQQNGSKALWFLPNSMQFYDQPDPMSVDYYARWRSHPLKPDAPNCGTEKGS